MLTSKAGTPLIKQVFALQGTDVLLRPKIYSHVKIFVNKILVAEIKLRTPIKISV